MILFLNRRAGATDVRLVEGIDRSQAHLSLPCLTTTWPRTIWFVRLTLSLKVLILASLALVGLRRRKKGLPAISPPTDHPSRRGRKKFNYAGSE